MEHLNAYLNGEMATNDTRIIADSLIELVMNGGWNFDCFIQSDELEKAVYWVKTAAENKYNMEGFKILWAVLNVITDRNGVKIPF